MQTKERCLGRAGLGSEEGDWRKSVSSGLDKEKSKGFVGEAGIPNREKKGSKRYDESLIS